MEMQLFAARKVAYCVLASQGWKGKESDIIHLDMDDRLRAEEIEKFGFIKVTDLGDTGQ
jgi:hypothetical protein